jgi:anti-sigma regulatory factor (Ser/Thr protein kinase)
MGLTIKNSQKPKANSQCLILTLADDGIPFDPTAHIPNVKATDERQVGGLGISLIRQIVDEMHYDRKEGENILTLASTIKRSVTINQSTNH